MTVAEMVEKYGEVRISKISGVAHDEKGVALITRSVVNNQVVETNIAEVHYRVAPRDRDPVTANTVDEALAMVI